MLGIIILGILILMIIVIMWTYLHSLGIPISLSKKHHGKKFECLEYVFHEDETHFLLREEKSKNERWYKISYQISYVPRRFFVLDVSEDIGDCNLVIFDEKTHKRVSEITPQ